MLRSVFHFFVFTSLFIACCAVLMVHQASLLFETVVPLALYLFVFFGSVCSYNFHWWLTPPEVPVLSVKYHWNLSNKNLHLALSLLGMAGAIVSALLLIEYWFWLVPTALFTFLYSAPMINHPYTRWLRKIAVGKTIYLALAWTHVTALLPLLVSPGGFSAQNVWYGVNRFFFLYTICIVFDRRDRESDQKAGIKSLITWLDQKGINRLFWVSQVAVLITSAVLYRWFSLTEILILLLPSLLLSLVYERSRYSRSDYLYYFFLDGLMALSAPLLILLRFAR